MNASPFPFGDKKWHALSGEEATAALDSRREGLTSAEAAARLAAHGPNTLRRERREGPLLLLWRQINNPIGWLLIGAGAIAVALGKYTDAAVVLAAAAINAVIGFLQEYRAGKSIEALSAMVPENASVIRDGAAKSVSAAELVPGDIVSLQSGDKVPADMRVIAAKNLLVEEAALTGESLPVGKRTDPAPPDAPLGDRVCMVYGGTMALQGTATCVVVATGAGTELGRINELLNKTGNVETPLTRQLAKVSAYITVVVVVMACVLFAFGVLIKGASLSESLLVAITLAVAAIPEGLPSVITIALAVGVRRMADRRAVVRYLPSVETLGSTTVICSDKTGTLTRNEMTVVAAWVDGHEYRFSGVGYEPRGEVERDGTRLAPGELPPPLRELLLNAVLCNDSTVSRQDDDWTIAGDPTEAALVVAGMKAGMDANELRMRLPRLDVIPFESDTKFMATLHRLDDAPRILPKGAPETVLRRCVLDEAAHTRIDEALETYARQGMRVIAFARKTAAGDSLAPEDAAAGFTFSGLMGMIDPPRSEAVEAIARCHAAGITVKMITGDHPSTAKAIGAQLGLLRGDGEVLEGRQLDAMDDEQLRDAAARVNVFARVAPEHKIRIVEALQARRQVVAMTGDGVNDAPALKRADIGVAMGITGTAASKEAAKLILTDDNFASIAAAVEEGRRVYDNLIKSLVFVLPTNLGLACVLTVAMFFLPTVRVGDAVELLIALSPTQILWINLVASVTLSMPLSFEVLEPLAMRRPPRDPDAPVFSRFILLRIILFAAVMSACACGIFYWEYCRIAGYAPLTPERHALALSEAQTICVTTVIFCQIFYLLNCRSLRNSIFSVGVFSNPAVFIGIAVLLLLQGCFLYLPPLRALFGTAPLDAAAWLGAAAVGFLILPVVLIEKWLWRCWEPPQQNCR